jgi:hypothetical protein
MGHTMGESTVPWFQAVRTLLQNSRLCYLHHIQHSLFTRQPESNELAKLLPPPDLPIFRTLLVAQTLGNSQHSP